MNKEIRWQQRFSNFIKALNQLEDAINLSKNRELSSLEEQGLVQAFEFTHELAWKTLKDFLEDKGNKDIFGSKDTVKLAFKLGLLDNADIWIDMISSRNESSHTYNEAVAEKIVLNIINNYFNQFIILKEKLSVLIEAE